MKTKNEERERLTHIGFKADGDTREGLAALIAALPPGAKRSKSTVIRRLIIEAAAKLVKSTVDQC